MAEPQTKVIGGDGTSTATYELAPGVFQYIESVLVEVDTSGSGDVQPTLTVQTTDGVPIADKQQDTPIDGGGSGRATWALRLSGNGASNTLGLHWGVNTDTTALGLELDTISAVRVNAGQGVTLDGSSDGTSTSNQVIVESAALGVTQRALIRILQGFFELTRGVGDVRTLRISDTGFWELFGALFTFGDTVGSPLFAIAQGTGVGTGTQVYLKNGSQFIVFDHLGNPMVTYTG